MAAADITVVPQGRGEVAVIWRQGRRVRVGMLSHSGNFRVYDRGKIIARGTPNFISEGKNDGGVRHAAMRAGLYSWVRGSGTQAALEQRFSGQYAAGYSVSGETVTALSGAASSSAIQQARGVVRGSAPAGPASTPRAGSPAQASSGDS